jgi:hypothetical protein
MEDALTTQPSESKPQSEIDLEIINAKAEIALRNRALTLSIGVTLMVLAAHIWFAYNSKSFVIPEIVYAIVLAPWLGAGTGKLLEVLTRGPGRK